MYAVKFQSFICPLRTIWFIHGPSLILNLSFFILILILLFQAYEKGLMIAVIPFTSKVWLFLWLTCFLLLNLSCEFSKICYFLQILEPCQSSLAYQPPNPWTMGILALLAEIYSMPNLKMNLKFDIEVLTYALSMLWRQVHFFPHYCSFSHRSLVIY